MRNELTEPVLRLPAPRATIGVSLVALCVLPLVFVAIRVAYVQSRLQLRYAEPWSKVTTVERVAPARNGRIVTSDGRVLARDETTFQVEAHYRWIESPPNETWLRREALRLVAKDERSDNEAIAAAEALVLESREAAWIELARFVPGLLERRVLIQQRVERVREAVERKRAERSSERNTAQSNDRLFETIWRELTTSPRRENNDPLVLAEEVAYHGLGRIPNDALQLVYDRPQRFAGMRVAAVSKRDYPSGALASHLIGFRGLPDVSASGDENAADRAERVARGLTGNERVGKAGVEQAFDRLLRGRDGVVLVDRRRDGLEILARTSREADHGDDVELTIDSRIQQAAEDALDRAIEGPFEADADRPRGVGGAVIVLNVHSGAVLAAASGPRVRAGIYQSASPAELAAVQADPRRPLFPRAFQMALPPGSVFKLLTAAAAVEDGWNPEREVFCQGYFESPDRERCALFRIAGYGHDRLTLPSALGVSCNVFFFELAEHLGPDRLRDWSSRCGFGWRTGVDLPHEASGRVPDEDGFPFAGSMRQFAIGQGELTVTPLQMARFTAAIANGGRLVRPHVWSGQRPDSEALIFGNETAATLRAGMEKAVHSAGGTARGLRDLPIAVAGKTGTAEAGSGRPSHAWFTCYFPARAPRYVITVAVEHGGSGGQVAAPVAADLVRVFGELDPTLLR